MKLVASAALALSLITMQAAAQDTAPDAWVTQATCADVMHRIDNPMDNKGLSSPISGVAYLGAIVGYIEGYRAGLEVPMTPDEFKDDVFSRCVNLPHIPFKTSVELAASDPA